MERGHKRQSVRKKRKKEKGKLKKFRVNWVNGGEQESNKVG